MKNRGPRPIRHDDGRPGLSPARARVLEYLQAQSDPISADHLARSFGQHVNTVRGHLDDLVESGLALRHRQGTSGRGRPAWHYRANPANLEPNARVREYGALAGALAAHLIRTSPTPTDDAHAAGREWGRELVRNRATGPASASVSTPARADARREVLGVLADLGFDPGEARDEVVLLRRCPLLDVARRYPEVVCHVHLGLVCGALEELGGDDAGVTLLPFAEPDGCRLILPHSDEAIRA